MIQVRDLYKTFGDIAAVAGVTFDICRGETFGLLGPNGAGKSTTIGMLTGAIRPDSGSIRIDGAKEPADAATRREIGIAPQTLSLYEELSAAENLSFFARLYRLSRSDLRARVDWALEFAGLSGRRKDRVKTFSGGMKRRLNLAVALVHDPRIIFLDEPTAGVDPQSRNHIFERIEQLRADGRTVVYTTHYMEEAQRLCDRVAIMDHGQVLDLDSVAGLVERYGGRSVVKAELAQPPADTSVLPAPLEGHSLRFESDRPLEEIGRLSSAGVSFQSLEVTSPDLETVFSYPDRQELARLMGTVLTMAAKDLKLISRDWLGLFFILGFPILMGIFFGSMYGSVDSGSASLNVAVVDEDNSVISAKFVELLGETGNVQIQQLEREEAINRVRRGQMVGMIAIPDGFGETAGILWMEAPAIKVGIDPSRQAESGMLEGMIMQACGKLMAARFQDPASLRPLIKQAQDEIAAATDIPVLLRPTLVQFMASLDGMLEKWADVRAAESSSSVGNGAGGAEIQLARIETIDVTREIPQGSTEALVRQLRSKWDISFPQAMLWGVLACAATFAITIVRERKQGTFLRLQVAPATRAHVLAGKAMACFLAVLGVIAVMVALGIVLGMRPRSPSLLLLASISVAFCFVGIMMLMSVIGKTEEAVSGAAWGANMFMAMFGGAMVPLVFMPAFMKTIGHLSPVKWSILSLEGAIWRGFTMSEMLPPCAALAITGAVCLVIGTAVLTRS